MNFSQKKFYSINFLVNKIKKVIPYNLKIFHNITLNYAD